MGITRHSVVRCFRMPLYTDPPSPVEVHLSLAFLTGVVYDVTLVCLHDSRTRPRLPLPTLDLLAASEEEQKWKKRAPHGVDAEACTR